jgi:Fe-S-cluster-containing hydrogenase component 2
MAAIVNKKECTGCELCVDTCPVEAITMVDGNASVNADECVDCGDCVDACPVEAITLD